MKQLHVEPLSIRIPIAKDHLWCIYDGDCPLFHGSASECRNWLDRHEALERASEALEAEEGRKMLVATWQRILQIVRLAKQQARP